MDGVKQTPLEGASLVFTFDDAQAPTKHTRQYFEMIGNRGIFKDGWWAGSRLGVPWGGGAGSGGLPAEPGPWELYDLAHDFTQAHDLADQNPPKLKELQDFFAAEAERNHVYPVSERGLGLAGARGGNTSSPPTRQVGHFGPGPNAYPHNSRRGSLAIRTPSQRRLKWVRRSQRRFFAQGGRTGGYALFVKNGQLVYEGTGRSAAGSAAAHTQIIASEGLPNGNTGP